MKPEANDRPMTTYEKFERIVFLLALIVLFCDLLVWRPY